MPNIKSAIKRVSVIEHKTLRNKMVKSATKTAIKKFDAATATKTATAELLSSASSAVDKAAAKGVISKNAANREKARMARELAKAEEVFLSLSSLPFGRVFLLPDILSQSKKTNAHRVRPAPVRRTFFPIPRIFRA